MQVLSIANMHSCQHPLGVPHCLPACPLVCMPAYMAGQADRVVEFPVGGYHCPLVLIPRLLQGACESPFRRQPCVLFNLGQVLCFTPLFGPWHCTRESGRSPRQVPGGVEHLCGDHRRAGLRGRQGFPPASDPLRLSMSLIQHVPACNSRSAYTGTHMYSFVVQLSCTAAFCYT